jgi:hypothetical protein
MTLGRRTAASNNFGHAAGTCFRKCAGNVVRQQGAPRGATCGSYWKRSRLQGTYYLPNFRVDALFDKATRLFEEPQPDFQKIESLLAEGLSLRSNGVSGWLMYGNLHLLRGEREKAIADFQRARGCTPPSPLRGLFENQISAGLDQTSRFGATHAGSVSGVRLAPQEINASHDHLRQALSNTRMMRSKKVRFADHDGITVWRPGSGMADRRGVHGAHGSPNWTMQELRDFTMQ